MGRSEDEEAHVEPKPRRGSARLSSCACSTSTSTSTVASAPPPPPPPALPPSPPSHPRRQRQHFRAAACQVTRLEFGYSSEVFRSFTFKPHDEWLCFSLVAGGRSVDFAASTEADLAVWLCGLSELLQGRPGGGVPHGQLQWRVLQARRHQRPAAAGSTAAAATTSCPAALRSPPHPIPRGHR